MVLDVWGPRARRKKRKTREKRLDYDRRRAHGQSMFNHFFTRSWLRWTATKYLQAHIAHALKPPTRRGDRAICLALAARCAPPTNRARTPIIPALTPLPCRPAPQNESRPLRTIVPNTPVRQTVSRVVEPSAERAAQRMYDERLHVSVKRSRPAAVKANGGLRGSTASRWR